MSENENSDNFAAGQAVAQTGVQTAAMRELLATLDLETLEVDLFRGRSPQVGWQRVFGGQVIGQALIAAQRTVGIPYTQEMIDNAARDAYGQATPESDAASGVSERYGEATHVRAFDGDPSRVTEMDALVAYLQVLGRLTEAPYKQAAVAPREE